MPTNVPSYAARNRQLAERGLTADVNADSAQLAHLTTLANAGGPGPNQSLAGPFVVVCLAVGAPGYYLPGDARDELDQTLFYLGRLCYAEFNPAPGVQGGHVSKLVFDPAGPYLAYRNGNATGGRTYPCRWAEVGSAATAYPSYAQVIAQNGAGYAWAVNEAMRSYAGGTVELFYKRKAPGGPAPDATSAAGDANWEKIGERDIAPAPGAVYVSRPDFVQMLADQQFGPYIGKLLVVTNRTSGVGSTANVWMPVLAEDAVGYEDAYTVDYSGGGNAVVTPVRYNIAADETTRRATGGVTPWRAGVPIAPGQLVSNAYGIVCYPASPSGISNPLAEPFLLSSSASANSRYIRLVDPLGIDYANEQLYPSQLGTPGARAVINPSSATSFTGSPGVFYLAFAAPPTAFAGAAVAVRNEDPATPMTLNFAGNGTVDGADTLVLAPGEWRVLGVRGDVPVAQRRAYYTVHKGNNLAGGGGGGGVDPNGIVTRKVATTATDVVLEQTGDSYGGSRLTMLSRRGTAGALFESISGPQYPPGLPLVDFAFRTADGKQSNFRFETRATAADMLSPENAEKGEFQILHGVPTNGTAGGVYTHGFGEKVTVIRTDLDLSQPRVYTPAVAQPPSALIMRSPDGTKWRITVNDSGLLSGVAL